MILVFYQSIQSDNRTTSTIPVLGKIIKFLENRNRKVTKFIIEMILCIIFGEAEEEKV